MKINKALRISIVFILFSLILPACTLPGIAPEATPTPTSTPTFTPTTTVTPTATITITPTITPSLTPRPNLTATLLYENFANKVQALYDAGYIATKEGKYKRFTDYPMELSKINWYDWAMTGDSPTDFIISSDIAWESASAAADNSGCGFAFHVQDGSSDSYIFYVSLKGVVFLNAYNSSWTRFGGATYGSAKQSGQVDLTLIVQGTTYKILIDGKLIKTYKGFESKLLHGKLGYVVLSGTNKSYGTRCTFKNTGLWTLP